MIASIAFLLACRQQISTVGQVDDAVRQRLQSTVGIAKKAVESFFDKPFAHAFTVRIFAHRSELDAYMASRWKAPATEKWMVAAGVGDEMLILSPGVWKDEAVQHDGSDNAHLQQIVTHELTHVYHGQVNANHTFDGMDEMAWFIEGLATYVAGQLDGPGKLRAADAIREGQAPKSLAEAWTGNYRYAVSGSIVRYVDRTYGRRALFGLLKAASTQKALRELHVTESAFLEGWKRAEGKASSSR